jgi:hypothetical protein
LCRLATNVGDSGCSQNSTSAATPTPTPTPTTTPATVTRALPGGAGTPLSGANTALNATPAAPTPSASPALFDITSEPLPPTQPSIIVFVAVSVVAGTLLTLSAIFSVRKIKAEAIARKLKEELNKKNQNEIIK